MGPRRSRERRKVSRSRRCRPREWAALCEKWSCFSVWCATCLPVGTPQLGNEAGVSDSFGASPSRHLIPMRCRSAPDEIVELP